MQESINTPIPNPKPASNKLFKIAIIIGLSIVIGLFLNAYLLLKKAKQPFPIGFPVSLPTPVIPSPTSIPDPTANWKTYSSQNGKYSLKYPQDWTIQGDEFFKEDIAMGMVSGMMLKSPSTQFNNWVSINSAGGDLQQGKNTLELWGKDSNGKLENIILDGVEGYKLTWQYSDPVSSASRVDVRVEKNGFLYNIELSVDNKTPNKNAELEIGNQILSTFKFTD